VRAGTYRTKLIEMKWWVLVFSSSGSQRNSTNERTCLSGFHHCLTMFHF
jgi:hypothetical protein